jgi:hypothetical protein
VVGEIRAFGFGGDTQKVTIWNGTELIQASLQDLGWIAAEGQSLDDGDFPELAALFKSPAPPNSKTSVWGSVDLKHDFNLPDLRGMFLRGYIRTPPPGTYPAGEPNDQYYPRTAPRPDMPTPPGDQGSNGPGVGSYQADEVGPHNHQSHRAKYSEICVSPSCEHYTGLTEHDWGWDGLQGGPTNTMSSVYPETRPRNVHVMYCVWTGRVATGARISEARVVFNRVPPESKP